MKEIHLTCLSLVFQTKITGLRASRKSDRRKFERKVSRLEFASSWAPMQVSCAFRSGRDSVRDFQPDPRQTKNQVSTNNVAEPQPCSPAFGLITSSAIGAPAHARMQLRQRSCSPRTPDLPSVRQLTRASSSAMGGATYPGRESSDFPTAP
jgi:hypothetical protein